VRAIVAQAITIHTGSNSSRTQKFFISNTGAATFSNSVTATTGTFNYTGGSTYGLTVANVSDNLRLKLGTTTGGYLNIQGQKISDGSVYALSLQAEGANVLIGTTTDAGYKLDVIGTGRFSGQVTSNTQFYVAATPPATNGGLLNIRDTVTATNVTSFAGVFFNSYPGNDYSIGKLTENNVGFLQIRNANSGAELLRINASGITTFSNLSGTGTRMVVADANGLLSTQAVPTGTITGSGTTNYVSKWTSGSAIGNSLIYDDGTYVGVNTTTNNGAKFVIKGVNGVPATTGTTTTAVLRLSSGTGLYNVLDFGTNESLDYSWIQSTRANSLGTYDYLAIQPNGGNLLVGTNTNSTFKFDVNGTGRFSGNLRVQNVSSGRYFDFVTDSSASYLDVSHSLNVRVNGASSLLTALTIASTGAATFSSSVTATAGIFNLNTTDGGFKIVGVNATPTTLSYLANNYFPKFYTRNHNYGITIFDQSESTAIQAADLVNGSNARALIFNPYGGNVLVGSTSDVGAKLYVNGGIRASEAIIGGGLLEFTGGWSASPYNASSWIRPASGVGLFLVNNAITKWAGFKPNSDFDINGGNFYVHSSNGNVGVGTTTDSGFKLDVNGTLRSVGTIRSNQGYAYSNGIINVTGGSSSWILLGTLSIAQGGHTAVITIEGGAGYNADEGQNGSARIFIRTSNGSPNGSGWYYSATLSQMGYSSAVASSCIITQTNSTTYNIYVNFGPYSGNTYYKVEGSEFTWTASNSNYGATAPTGGQTLTNVFKVLSSSTFSSNVGISGNVDIGGYTHSEGRVRIQGGSDQGSQLNLWANSSGNTFLAGFNFAIHTGSNSSRTQKFFISNTGDATFSSSVTASSFFESSDSRIKILLEDDLDYLSIANVSAKYYEKNGKAELGYFAQDFESILPSAISKNEDGYLNLSYREVHTAKIAALEKEVKELKEKLKNK
jgi:hypothetical protein